MIKKIGYAFALALVLVSCNESDSAKKDLNTGKFEKEEIPSCDCADLNIDSLDVAYFDSIPYTGICYTYYPNTQNKMEERPFLKGKLHGNYLIYNNGTNDTLSSVKYINGEIENDNLNKNNICDCDELKSKVEEEKDIWFRKNHRYTGVCYVMNADSTHKIMERTFKDGLVDGDQLVFDNYGEIIQMEIYKDGELIRTKFFTKD